MPDRSWPPVHFKFVHSDGQLAGHLARRAPWPSLGRDGQSGPALEQLHGRPGLVLWRGNPDAEARRFAHDLDAAVIQLTMPRVGLLLLALGHGVAPYHTDPDGPRNDGSPAISGGAS